MKTASICLSATRTRFWLYLSSSCLRESLSQHKAALLSVSGMSYFLPRSQCMKCTACADCAGGLAWILWKAQQLRKSLDGLRDLGSVSVSTAADCEAVVMSGSTVPSANGGNKASALCNQPDTPSFSFCPVSQSYKYYQQGSNTVKGGM